MESTAVHQTEDPLPYWLAEIGLATNYLLERDDLIPDHLPEVGLADDVLILQRVITRNRSDLSRVLSEQEGLTRTIVPSQFEEIKVLGREQEQQRLATYFHEQLALGLMELVFSIESVRAQLELEKHPTGPKLKNIRDHLSGMLKPIRDQILNVTGPNLTDC